MTDLFHSKLKFSFWLFLIGSLFTACDSDKITDVVPDVNTVTEVRHGYIYIGCQAPPYYLKLDSMRTYCSIEGALPDTLPPISWSSLEIDTLYSFCGTYLDEDYASEGDHDFMISYNPTINIQSTIPDASLESLPDINIDGNVFQIGDYPYLTGLRISTESLEVTIQIVNVYIGGCFHDLIIWSSEDQ